MRLGELSVIRIIIFFRGPCSARRRAVGTRYSIGTVLSISLAAEGWILQGRGLVASKGGHQVCQLWFLRSPLRSTIHR